MFKKLVSSLPFNPSLIHQVAFYAKRMHREESLRRIGFGLTALAMLVQLFAYIAPPTPSLASSTNDLVHGGGTKQQILDAYRNGSDALGRNDIKAVFDYYLGSGAADAAIANGIEEDIISTPETNYWSVGRSLRDSADIPVAIPGAATTIYQRTLHDWPGSNGASWSAIRVKSAVNGQDMWILKDCGNLVTKGPFTPVNPTPRIKKISTPVPGSTVKPGDTIEYGVVFGNSGPGSMLDTNIFDTVPSNTTYVAGSIGGGVNAAEGDTMHWWPGTPGKVWGVDPNDWPVWYRVTVNNNAPNGTLICNDNARITWNENGATKTLVAEPICHTVSVDKCPDGSFKPANGECPPPPETCPDGSIKPESGCTKQCDVNGTITTIPIDNECPKPLQTVVCTSLQEITPITHRTRRNFKTTAATTNGGKAKEFLFDHDNDGKDYKIIPTNENGEATFEYEYPDTQKATTYASKVFIKGQANGATNITSNSLCELAIAIPEQPAPKSPLLVRSKKVKNNTQKIEDANGTTAKAGDELTYTLTTKNIGDGDATSYTLAPEDLKDVLEYADISTYNDAVYDGEVKNLRWEPVDIKAGKEVSKVFTVKIKNPIPATPVSTSDVKSFDLTMQNSYGNDTSVKLPKPVAKQVEGIAKALPNTGPTSGIAIGFLITTIVAYFFARSRLMARELDMVRAEYAAGGF